MKNSIQARGFFRDGSSKTGAKPKTSTKKPPSIGGKIQSAPDLHPARSWVRQQVSLRRRRDRERHDLDHATQLDESTTPKAWWRKQRSTRAAWRHTTHHNEVLRPRRDLDARSVRLASTMPQIARTDPVARSAVASCCHTMTIARRCTARRADRAGTTRST